MYMAQMQRFSRSLMKMMMELVDEAGHFFW